MNTLDQLTIYNQALAAIGVSRWVESLTENSNEARALSLFWNSSLDQTLQDFDWNFATRFLELTPINITVNGWNFVYAYPSDCLKCQFIMPTFSDTELNYKICQKFKQEKIPFEIVNIDSQTVVIVTNLESPTLVYTTRITNLLLWTPKAINALKYYLAAQVAAPLSAAIELAERVGAAYQAALIGAGVENNNERFEEQPESEIITARR
jgi:hypothetical protein